MTEWLFVNLEVFQDLLPFGGVFFGRDHFATLQPFEYVESIFHSFTMTLLVPIVVKFIK
jgi:hypothetical protein